MIMLSPMTKLEISRPQGKRNSPNYRVGLATMIVVKDLARGSMGVGDIFFWKIGNQMRIIIHRSDHLLALAMRVTRSCPPCPFVYIVRDQRASRGELPAFSRVKWLAPRLDRQSAQRVTAMTSRRG